MKATLRKLKLIFDIDDSRSTVDFYMKNENEQIPEFLLEDIHKKLIDTELTSFRTQKQPQVVRKKIESELSKQLLQKAYKHSFTKPEFKPPTWE